MDVVIGVLHHQIDVSLQPVDLSYFWPFAVAQPGFSVTVREADFDHEIVHQGGSSGEGFARLLSDCGGHRRSATSATATAAPSPAAAATPAAPASSGQNCALQGRCIVIVLFANA